MGKGELGDPENKVITVKGGGLKTSESKIDKVEKVLYLP